MADWTKAQLRNEVLIHLAVLGAGQSAKAEDAAIVDPAIDSAHGELRKEGYAPFPTSAIPEWAQPGFRDYVGTDVAPAFGLSPSTLVAPGVPMTKEQALNLAKQRLARQVSGYKHNIRTPAEYF